VEIGNLEKVLRVGEGRRLKRLQEQAAYITSLEPEFEGLSAADLQAKTAEFRQRLENGETVDDLVFEAFAAVREARKRASDQRMFDVQLMGGIVLHEGDTVELTEHDGNREVRVDGEPSDAEVPELARLGERVGADYSVEATRIDGDFWEVRVSAL
jgi:hypothetical protein